MILHKGSAKEVNRKLLELINEYSSFRIKLLHRNLLYSYTLTMKKSERQIKETIAFTFAMKIIK